mmetsp:Transcript_81602/g.195746  ORF Transcript_81602/g.195746 Transcript_81602/m.195746 type:complete len:203 (+) Transcript_81602:43-651(+)
MTKPRNSGMSCACRKAKKHMRAFGKAENESLVGQVISLHTCELCRKRSSHPPSGISSSPSPAGSSASLYSAKPRICSCCHLNWRCRQRISSAALSCRRWNSSLALCSCCSKYRALSSSESKSSGERAKKIHTAASRKYPKISTVGSCAYSIPRALALRRLGVGAGCGGGGEDGVLTVHDGGGTHSCSSGRSGGVRYSPVYGL